MVANWRIYTVEEESPDPIAGLTISSCGMCEKETREN